MRTKITVYEQAGKHYATISHPNNMGFNPSGVNIKFSVEDDISPEGLKKLQERARKKARERGIAYVINLD